MKHYFIPSYRLKEIRLAIQEMEEREKIQKVLTKGQKLLWLKSSLKKILST